jgi:hypothetical protein
LLKVFIITVIFYIEVAIGYPTAAHAAAFVTGID